MGEGAGGKSERKEKENVYKIQESAWFDVDLVKTFAGFHQYVHVHGEHCCIIS